MASQRVGAKRRPMAGSAKQSTSRAEEEWIASSQVLLAMTLMDGSLRPSAHGETDLSELADSYVCGIADAPLLGDTIGRSLDQAVRRWGGREALVSPSHDVRWTWAELAQRVDALAAGFLALGLERGARIGVWSLNRPEWTLTQFAAAKAGLILVTINPAYRLSELEFALAKVGCAAIVTATAFKTSNYMEMLNTLMPELARAEPGDLHSARLPQLRAVIQVGGPASPGTIPFEQVAGMGGARHRDELAALGKTLQFDDAVNIQFTSGTTGSPKGVTLTHHNILNNGYFVGRAMRLTEQDRICIPVPLYHCFGMVMGNLAAVTSGATMVYPGEGFDPLVRCRPSSAKNARRCTACRPCSSPNSTILILPNSTCRRCAPASWPARPARSR